MASNLPPESESESQIQAKLESLADDFLSRSREGESPSIDEYVQRHPEIGGQLREMLNTIQFVDNFRERTSKPASASEPKWEIQLGDQVGAYQIQKRLGKGGMGVVYLATDTRLGRSVAIKLVSSNRRDDPHWLNRFQREAKITSALNHPNIVTIHEIGEHEGALFIVAEYVEGTTLQALLENRRLSISETANYAIQILKGVSAAHAAGIVHRDLKPDNVMVRSDGLLKILDFGLAKYSSSADDGTGLTVMETKVGSGQSGRLMGTAAYMSPEQLAQKELGPRSDVFSLGIVLYRMLADVHPFEAGSINEVIAAILNSTPQPVTDHRADCPLELNQLVLDCLTKKDGDRPDANQVLESLRRISGIGTGDSELFSAGVTVPPTRDSKERETRTIHSPEHSTDRIPASPGRVRYAMSGQVNIAWQEIGDGPIDVVFVMGWVSHLDYFWKEPGFASFLQRLAKFSRVILFDKRGTGLSDKVPVDELPTLETRMDDVRAVMDAAGSQNAVLCGVSEGGPLCALFAATYPQKTIALTMIGCYARRLWAEDYPWGPTSEQREVFLRELAADWGGPLGIEDRAPSKANDPEFRQWWADYLRMGASPGAAVALTKMNAQIDVRSILPTIQVPTLVIHRTGDRCLKVEEGRHMADLIPAAKFVELPGDDHLPFVGDAEQILEEIEEFLTGRRGSPDVDRVLATVLSISVDVDLSNAYSEAELSGGEQFKTLIGHEAKLFRGQNLTIENSSQVVMTFDGPARAVRAANSIVELATRLGINIRCGIDTGACDIAQDSVTGPAVETARSIGGIAPDFEVLVSDSVNNLVSGSGLQLEPFSIDADSIDSSNQLNDLSLFILKRPTS